MKSAMEKKPATLIDRDRTIYSDEVYVYLASEADDVMAGASQALQNAKARIRELEKRLVACESAMLVGCDTSHRAIVGYMQTYPDPYSGS